MSQYIILPYYQDAKVVYFIKSEPVFLYFNKAWYLLDC